MAEKYPLIAEDTDNAGRQTANILSGLIILGSSSHNMDRGFAIIVKSREAKQPKPIAKNMEARRSFEDLFVSPRASDSESRRVRARFIPDNDKVTQKPYMPPKREYSPTDSAPATLATYTLNPIAITRSATAQTVIRDPLSKNLFSLKLFLSNRFIDGSFNGVPPFVIRINIQKYDSVRVGFWVSILYTNIIYKLNQILLNFILDKIHLMDYYIDY